MIEYNYKAAWVLDSLPAGFRVTSKGTNEKLSIYQDGFPIGFVVDREHFINNHHNLVIQVYQTSVEKEET